jgi:signal transduction histidine kinase
MRETRTPQEAWLYRRFRNFSLHQLNSLSILFILIFTVLFSLLLIHDEYQEFESILGAAKREYYEAQQLKIVHAAQQFERLFDYAMQQNRDRSEAELDEFVALFTQEEEHRFIALYDPEMQPLHGSSAVEGYGEFDFASGKSVEGVVKGPRGEEPALLFPYALKHGYRLVSGVYLKPYETMLEAQYAQLKSRLIRIILEIATLSFILFGFILGISKIVNTMLERDVEIFLKFFEGVASKYQVMNYTTLFFREFRTMAGHANEMVDTIVEQRASLEQLNLTLEEKVRQKTAKLQEQNTALAEEKQFSQELLASQKQFIRYAIHETNTPLSVIVTNIELYQMRHGKDRYLAKIEAAVKNIFTIYDDLSYLVKKDQVEYPPQRIELCSYLQSRIDFFEEVAAFAGLSFSFSCSASPAYVMINETKLQRIVDNNLTNAIKYTRQGEEIRVEISAEEEGCLFSVASRSSVIGDTGKIFEAYYRERRRSDGFGLGLNLVKSICDEEGVAIMIESTEAETRFAYRFREEAS